MKLAQKIAVNYLRLKFKILSSISPQKAAEQAFELFCTPPTRDVKKLPEVFKQAEEIQFDIEGYHIVGYRWNAGGIKKVLILHGFESTVINFEKYIQPLIEKHYEVLAFDAPAHGRSSGKQITGLTYKNLVEYLHEHYGPIRSAMGHSFGGFALSLALAELKHDETYHAVFIAPSSETSTAVSNFFKFLHLDGKTREVFDRIITEKGGHAVEWFTVGRALKDIRARVLWIHDEGDTVTPFSDAKKVMDQNHTNVEFVVTEGLGHSRIYRDNNVIMRVVDFM